MGIFFKISPSDKVKHPKAHFPCINRNEWDMGLASKLIYKRYQFLIYFTIYPKVIVHYQLPIFFLNKLLNFPSHKFTFHNRKSQHFFLRFGTVDDTTNLSSNALS